MIFSISALDSLVAPDTSIAFTMNLSGARRGSAAGAVSGDEAACASATDGRNRAPAVSSATIVEDAFHRSPTDGFDGAPIRHGTCHGRVHELEIVSHVRSGSGRR